MSKPNECEVNQALCHQINVMGTRHVSEACSIVNARLVFLSTDFVFGDHGPYSEEDLYDPVNYYGQSKMEAEQWIMDAGLPFSIVRTVLVYAAQKDGMQPTFLQWVKARLEQGQTLRVFTDQLRTATYVLDLVKSLETIIQQQASGIFHICGREVLSPYQMACAVAKGLGYDNRKIEPVTRADFQEAARRPRNSTLKIDKANRELGFNPKSFFEVLPLLIA
jgi:dTDP-4-dehydrorhamnose reductase